MNYEQIRRVIHTPETLDKQLVFAFLGEPPRVITLKQVEDAFWDVSVELEAYFAKIGRLEEAKRRFRETPLREGVAMYLVGLGYTINRESRA